jgi:hypothetical protein
VGITLLARLRKDLRVLRAAIPGKPPPFNESNVMLTLLEYAEITFTT